MDFSANFSPKNNCIKKAPLKKPIIILKLLYNVSIVYPPISSEVNAPINFLPFIWSSTSQKQPKPRIINKNDLSIVLPPIFSTGV